MSKTYRRFYKALGKCDAELGVLLSMLAEDHLSDNTVIFCFGDNGGSLPGSKGYVSETGLKIPLAVYIPEKWRRKWGYGAATRISGVVDFTDFAPTLLHIAGCEIPPWLDGTPFLGEGIPTDSIDRNSETVGTADRFDELYAFSRTLRRGNYKYVRNYYPYAPASLMATYRYRQMAFREWRDLYDAGRLDSVQSRFFMPQGPEALYDLTADPYETHDLSHDTAYISRLTSMRQQLESRMDSLHDLGMLPEYLIEAESDGCPGEYAPRISERLRRLQKIAAQQTATAAEFETTMERHLRSDDEAERYWAATNAVWFSDCLSKQARKAIAKALASEPSAAVKAKLLTASVLAGHRSIGGFREILATARSEAELLLILNDMAYLHERLGKPEWRGLCRTALPFSSENIRWRLNYLCKAWQ